MLSLLKHYNYNFPKNLWMEKGANLRVPGGNYWCHERMEQVILQLSAVSGRYISIFVYPYIRNVKVLYC